MSRKVVSIGLNKLKQIIQEELNRTLKRNNLAQKSDVKELMKAIKSEFKKTQNGITRIGKKIDKFGIKNDKIYKDILLSQKLLMDKIDEFEERLEKLESINWKN